MRRLLLSLVFLLFASPALAAQVFAVCTATCTWDNVSTAMWSTSSGGATGATPPSTGDQAVFDGSTCVGGVTCTITVNANLTIGSLSFGACTASTTGCILDFSVNNNNITFTSSATSTVVNISGTGVRTLRMGNGNWTIGNNTGTNWTAATSTNLTLTANSSTIIINNVNSVSTVTFNGGGTSKVYNNIVVNGNTNRGVLSMVGGPVTFNTMTFNGPNYVDFSGSGTYTMTSLVVNGTASSIVSFFGYTWAPTSVTANYAWLGSGSCTGTPTFSNSFNGQNPSGCAPVPPSAGGGGIISGWLLQRDFPDSANDNFPVWLGKAS